MPVKAEYKNEVKGLVHDSSSSGATVFIEPMAVVEANNELRMLENKEKLEIERVLSELSAGVAGISDGLCLNYANITEIAFCFGCANLSIKLDAEFENEFITAGGDNIPVSVAKGFARYDSKTDSKFVDVFNKADDAMYGNKRKTKGTV